MYIKLTGKTRHGKNKIYEYGEKWKVIKKMDHVPAVDYHPGMLIRSVSDMDVRWIRSDGDLDFDVEFLEEDACTTDGRW